MGPIVFLLGAAVIIGVGYFAVVAFLAVDAPERIMDPTQISDENVPSDGVAVPDGGDLTNVPTQAAPDSPSRTVFTQEQTEGGSEPQ